MELGSRTVYGSGLKAGRLPRAQIPVEVCIAELGNRDARNRNQLDSGCLGEAIDTQLGDFGSVTLSLDSDLILYFLPSRDLKCILD